MSLSGTTVTIDVTGWNAFLLFNCTTSTRRESKPL